MNARSASRFAAAPSRTVHGVPHFECQDCGDWIARYDVVERADEGTPGFFCRRCSDARDVAPTAPAPPPVVTCSCGRGFDAAAWAGLPCLGTMDDGDGGLLEMRNCPCGSTQSTELQASELAEAAQ